MDCVRAEDAYTSRLGYEEHIPGQVPAAWPCPPRAPPSPSLGGCQAGFCAPPWKLHLLFCIHLGAYGAVHREVEGGAAQCNCGVQAEPVSPSLVPLQTRDWNEELQTTRELPRKNLPERLLRERAIFKVPMSLVSDCSLRPTCTVAGFLFPFWFSCGQEGTQVG